MLKKLTNLALVCLLFSSGLSYATETDSIKLPEQAAVETDSSNTLADAIAENRTGENGTGGFIRIKPQKGQPGVEEEQEAQEEEAEEEELEAKAETNIFGKKAFEKTFETGIVKDIKLIGNHDLRYNGSWFNNGISHSVTDNTSSLEGFSGHFRDGTLFNFTMIPFSYSKGYPSFANHLFEYYLQRDIGKHHKITIGQQRTPNTIEGSRSSFGLPIGRRSMFANAYSNITALGVKVTGNYDWIEYNAGVFDTGRFLKGTFNAPPEFAGLVSFKPIRNNKKYGTLRIGGGLDVGKLYNSYGVYSAHALYDYKKARVEAEYAFANGYNGRVNSRNKSDGYYVNLLYRINKKFEPFIGIDHFNANKNEWGENEMEYCAGLHYYLKGSRARFTISYIYSNHQSEADSNKLFTMFEVLL